jgi:hypothetical protein
MKDLGSPSQYMRIMRREDRSLCQAALSGSQRPSVTLRQAALEDGVGVRINV